MVLGNSLIKTAFQKTRSALWLCCWLVLVIVMVGLLFKNSSSLLASFMMVSAHLEVGFVFCWIIVFDVSGYHNYLIRFLSQKFFVRVAKTTYPMYLLSPIITMMIYGLMQTGSTFRFPEIVSYVKWKIDNYLIFLLSGDNVLCDHQDCRSNIHMVHCLFRSSIRQHVEIYFTKRTVTREDEMKLKVKQ